MSRLNGLQFSLFLLIVYIQCQKEIPNCNYTFVEKSCRSDQTPFWRNAPVKNMIGGTPYNSSDYPFLVSFQKAVKEPTEQQEGCYEHFCGGSLIAPNLILTAAHCFGETRLVGPQSTQPSEKVYVSISPQCRHLVLKKDEERLFVEAVFIHPKYDDLRYNYDIAIVQLMGLYSGVTAEIDNGLQDFSNATDLTTIGYGLFRTEEKQNYVVRQLQGAKLKIISENLCKEFLDSYREQWNEDYLNYTNMVCAYNQQADTCEGDSGGPLLYGNKIVGIVSWGPAAECSGLGDRATPGVFTRVSQFYPWIYQTMKNYSVGALPPPIPDDFSLSPVPEPTPVTSTAPKPKPSSFTGRQFRETIVPNAPQEVKDLVKLQEDIVLIMANKAEEAFIQREALMKECSCIPNSCSNILGEDATCGFELGYAPRECGRYNTGTMYSMERGMASMPLPDMFPGNLTDGLKASICLMNYLEKAVPLLNQKNVSYTALFGTEQGAMYSFPGRLRGRSNETGVEQWNYCEAYDPRTRPWYHEGATGPLDIVLVVDISESMNDLIVGSLSRWDIVQSALLKFVDTLTFSDYFNIVFFNLQDTSLATGLLQANTQNREKAKEFISENFPGGYTNFEVAFDSAFSALISGIEGDCNKVILFMTDGKDNRVDADKNRTRDILDKVEEMQTNLQLISNKRATIFSFSIGELADDSIPRQLACMHNGSWAPIAAQDDPLTVFNTFLKFMASARNTTRIYWSETFEDASGLGQMISAVMPVYTPQTNLDIPGALLGVVSHDILINDIKQLVGDRQTDQIISALQEDSKQCDDLQNNQCLQQVLRGKDLECADLSYQNADCIKFDDKYYRKSQTASTWPEAKDFCYDSGGRLASPNSKVKQSFLAGVASFEGSWIGLSHNGISWIWQDATDFTNKENFWGYGQGEISIDEIFCGTIAPSGTSKNIYSQPCRSPFTYICEFENLPEECGGDFVDLDDPNYQFLMPRIQQCASAESLDSIRFFDTIELPEILPEDLFCFDDFSMPENFLQDLYCCPAL